MAETHASSKNDPLELRSMLFLLFLIRLRRYGEELSAYVRFGVYTKVVQSA